ncbi:arsenosugar biosynthesis radical SAM (seleno)protein ArsS [Limnoraphis robusta Tam1]|uniref:Arsenosugar biosynthesis radical SAM (Seleno)protein ArsS n=1 Tax=Limnoraphis robusta CCNP1315 TaxID=3110306 RepID=A0ABU5TY00_9CYAN|nr:arsenosugar biosynthesis radical SAM (seleno)protein ArsS [Limnoraphis robusta]MEA5519803.1 arsenosugar biosynthesis radical SAM (seleno)protein ArsS [Limnoraphis robusta CCNP1315]MEA5540996.1 arsenosugar biosynthesis radical SAM (seleno)protein ArsS [Limnoraphis robusta Tam1]MEA5548156.1 arsenosugar biosynthesis radical SAM (seleno)protein ArsS [Limnoraphis robusta CCNP1324]
MLQTTSTPFHHKLGSPLLKQPISVLQINLGKRCNLACRHCHVEASPKRTEELSPEICDQLIELIHRFPQIQTVDLTGGAPEMNYGFKPLVEAARSQEKEVIVRSNLTIYFVDGFQDLPEYCAQYQLRIIASLPCYLEDNVDKMRGKGVYQDSIAAIQCLNQLGYGRQQNLVLDLVYNPALPQTQSFSLPPEQHQLEAAYKRYLKQHFDLDFNQLFTITNLPIGRTKEYLKYQKIHQPYLTFLEEHYNSNTVEHLMCRNQLSIDYQGNIYDCDFNQMENIPARTSTDELLTVKKLLEFDSLDVIREIKTAPFCYGCTAGCGSSCGGALV